MLNPESVFTYFLSHLHNADKYTPIFRSYKFQNPLLDNSASDISFIVKTRHVLNNGSTRYIILNMC